MNRHVQRCLHPMLTRSNRHLRPPHVANSTACGDSGSEPSRRKSGFSSRMERPLHVREEAWGQGGWSLVARQPGSQRAAAQRAWTTEAGVLLACLMANMPT